MTSLFTFTLAFMPSVPPPPDTPMPPKPFPFAEAEAQISEAIEVDELKAHVYRLASPQFVGRRGPGAARASRHIAEIFKKLKLKPAFGDSYFQVIPNFLNDPKKGNKNAFLGRNVGAIVPGADPKLKDEWILLSAHFDHLGVKNGILYPGADDNATGVAMLIEVAERLFLRREKPKRTIMFVAFDLEEVGLLGSRYFAAHPPYDVKKLKTFITADMLGRSMANLMDEYVFLLGTESSKQLLQLVKSMPPKKSLKVGRLGTDLIGTRSDYGPFRDRKIPYLFFCTGQHPDYHTPRDLPDRIDYHRMQTICTWIGDLTWRLANDATAPMWNAKPEPDLAEVKTIHVLLQRVLKNPKVFPLKEQQRKIVANVERRLGKIIARGFISRSERTWLMWTSRILLLTVF